jgi:nucleolin
MSLKRTSGRDSRRKDAAPYDDSAVGSKAKARATAAAKAATEVVQEDEIEELEEELDEVEKEILAGNNGDLTNTEAISDDDSDKYKLPDFLTKSADDETTDGDQNAGSAQDENAQQQQQLQQQHQWQQQQLQQQQQAAPNVKIYIGNLPYHTDKTKLYEFAATTGCQILSCDIVIDRDGRSRGFGLVEFSTPEENKIALDLLNNTVTTLNTLLHLIHV